MPMAGRERRRESLEFDEELRKKIRRKRPGGPVHAAINDVAWLQLRAGYTRIVTVESRFLPCEYGFLRGCTVPDRNGLLAGEDRFPCMSARRMCVRMGAAPESRA